MSTCSFFECALFLSVLLLLQFQLAFRFTAATENSADPPELRCPTQGTAVEKCVHQLISGELLPIGDAIANGSEWLKLADKLFVEGVRAYIEQTMEESTIYSTSNELAILEHNLSQYFMVLNSSHQVNVTQCIVLLEEDRALLQQFIEQNISQANELSLESQELLSSIQVMLSELHSMQFELNSTLHQLLNISVGRINHAINITREMATVAAVHKRTAEEVFATVVERFEIERGSCKTTEDILSSLSWIASDMSRLEHVLEELNRASEDGDTLAARATNEVLDTIQTVGELRELWSSVEVLLVHGEEAVHDANDSIVAAFQLTQNGSHNMVEESAHILDEYLAYRDRLRLLDIGASIAILHALALSQQVQAIIGRGNTFLNDEFVDEFGRLDLINATAIRSRAVSDDVITATLSVGELVDSAEAVETRARQLVESVGNITTVSPLTELVEQVNGTLAHFNGRQAMNQNIIISAEEHLSTIEEGVQVIMNQLDHMHSSIDSASGAVREVSTLTDGLDLDHIVAEINKTTADATISLLQTATNISQLSVQLTLEADLLNLSQSLQNQSATQSLLSDTLTRSVALVSATYTLIDQIGFPLEFGEDHTMPMSVNSSQLISSSIHGEFRSLSFHFSASNISNSILTHLISSRNQARTELLVELFDVHLRILFKTITSRGCEFSRQITISGRSLEPHRTYTVFIARTEVNVHVDVTDVESSEVTSVHRGVSSRIRNAFSSSSFLRTATLHVGGSPSLYQESLNYTGCLGGIELNGAYLNLWNLTANLGPTDLYPCSGSYVADDDGKIHLSLDKDQIARQWVNGSFLPLVIDFQTQFPNGLFLYTHSNSTALVLNTFSVYLDLGRIEVRVTSGNRQRTLTTRETYNSGSLITLRIDLEGNSRLALTTGREVVKKRLQTVPIASLSTYSELLVGGVGERVRVEEGVDVSNFTGCVSVFSSSSVLKVPKCFEQDNIECTYCSPHESVLSADFYGASYAVFPAFAASEYLDISLNFRTYFSDGVIMYIGSAAQRKWLALLLIGGRFNLLFQTEFNSPFSFLEGNHLNDGSLHSATIIRSGVNLSVTVDGTTSPFGYVTLLFPVGQFPTDLFVGGLPHSQHDFPRIPLTGFKGYLENFHVNAKALDFSESTVSEAVTFYEGGDIDQTQGQNGHDFFFSGLSSFAEFDIGRFLDNFTLGFQFNAEAGTGLLFYVFSRRRQDKMAIQLNDSTIQLYIEDSSSSEWIVSPSQNVSLMEWHDVRLSQQGDRITVTLDSNTDLQQSATLPMPLRTTSLLYIGGLPDGQRIPTSSSVVTEHYAGCLRTHYLSLATRHGVDMQSCEGIS